MGRAEAPPLRHHTDQAGGGSPARRYHTGPRAGLKPRPYITRGQNSNLTPNCAERGVLHCVLTVPNAEELQFWFGSQ